MNESVIGGVFIVVAAAVTGVLTIVASRSGVQIGQIKEENVQLKRQMSRLLRQIEAYHLLEQEYADDIAGEKSGKAPRTVKSEYRNRVVERHECDRPGMTANEAKEELQKLV